jgi:hypothetical protein
MHGFAVGGTVRSPLLFLAVVAFFTANVAFGLPVTACSTNSPNPGFTCNLYDTSNNLPPGDGGTFTDTPPALTTPSPVSASVSTEWWAICANPILPSCTSAPSTWSDLVEIVNTGTSSTVQLFSRGCNDGSNPLDVTCFPATIPPPTYISETSPETTFHDGVPGDNDVFNVFETSVPEPATLPLFCFGLSALGFLVRRQAKKA